MSDDIESAANRFQICGKLSDAKAYESGPINDMYTITCNPVAQLISDNYFYRLMTIKITTRTQEPVLVAIQR